MRPRTTVKRAFRCLLATVFALMSLGHGPVMAFAHVHSDATGHAAMHGGATAASQAGAHGHDGSHGHRADATLDADRTITDEDVKPTAAAGAVGCFVSGCFVVLASTLNTPAIDLILFERLAMVPARILVQIPASPTDPPPRLQV